MRIIGDRKAQFMLLASFIIAIGLVITTVILNSIIFEINTAVGAGSEPSKTEIVNLVQITQDEARSAYRTAAKTGDIGEFNKQMNIFNGNLSKIYVLHGEGVNVTWDTSNWAYFRYPAFTENGTANGIGNWTVMESVMNLSIFELRNVSGSNFEVNITNQTTGAFVWSLKLDGTDSIKISNYTIVSYHSVNFSHINLLNNSYNLNTSIGSNSSKIRFINGTAASGRFNIKGSTSYNSTFTRARDYILNATVTFSSSRVRSNITVPVSVPR